MPGQPRVDRTLVPDSAIEQALTTLWAGVAEEPHR